MIYLEVCSVMVWGTLVISEQIRLIATPDTLYIAIALKVWWIFILQESDAESISTLHILGVEVISFSIHCGR